MAGRTEAGRTERLLKALRRIRRREQGDALFMILVDAEECEDLGWAEPRPEGGYRLTKEGNRVLDRHG